MPEYRRNPEALSRLSPEQYRVTQRGGTERPFENEYWDNKKPGIYVDVVSGKPRFASPDKYESKSGWPSFTKPIESENVVEKHDATHGMVRTEVRSTHGDIRYRRPPSAFVSSCEPPQTTDWLLFCRDRRYPASLGGEAGTILSLYSIFATGAETIARLTRRRLPPTRDKAAIITGGV